MFTGELKVGDRLVWRYTCPVAYAQIVVTDLFAGQWITEANEPWAGIEDRAGNRTSRRIEVLRYHCMRDVFYPCDFMFGDQKLLDEQWTAQEKTAAQETQAAATENPNREPTGQDDPILPRP